MGSKVLVESYGNYLQDCKLLKSCYEEHKMFKYIFDEFKYAHSIAKEGEMKDNFKSLLDKLSEELADLTTNLEDLTNKVL